MGGGMAAPAWAWRSCARERASSEHSLGSRWRVIGRSISMRIVFAVEPERGSGEDSGDGKSEREGWAGLAGAEEVQEWGGEAEQKKRGSGDFAVVTAAREIPDQKRKDDESGCRFVELRGVQRDAQGRAIPDGGDAAGVGDGP